MKLVCSRSDLNTNLSFVSRAVPTRPTHPILSNVLLYADEENQRVRLTGFDLSLGIQVSFPAQVVEGGVSAIPAKLFNDIVSRLPDGELTLVCDTEAEANDTAVVNLTSASGHFQLRRMDAEDFPALPIIEEGEMLHLSVEALTQGLGGALFAASSEETKQVLTGVHLTLQQDSLEFAATDGHRLAVVESPNSDGEGNAVEDFEVTIPARALRELERLLGTQGKDDKIALRCDEGQVVFELGDQRLTSRKLEGAYPAYHQLITNQFSKQVTLGRKRLISSLELVAVIADPKHNLVKFSLDSENQNLSLSVDAKERGNAEQSMPAEISGDGIEIAFNVK